jgi:hypothetical protein
MHLEIINLLTANAAQIKFCGAIALAVAGAAFRRKTSFYSGISLTLSYEDGKFLLGFCEAYYREITGEDVVRLMFAGALLGVGGVCVQKIFLHAYHLPVGVGRDGVLLQ